MAKAKKEAVPTSNRKQLEKFSEVLTLETVEWIDELRKYREHVGVDDRYIKKANMGITLIGHAGRLLATLENARRNDLIASRLLVVNGDVASRQIAASSK